ncbi:Uncharacterised protein [Vibrio cholerae]|nr:Uncharacterised protein [Vibrio cholerae]CSC89906.1 Uncharacterised protein [Vibrio cholerae]
MTRFLQFRHFTSVSIKYNLHSVYQGEYRFYADQLTFRVRLLLLRHTFGFNARHTSVRCSSATG